MQSQSVRHRLRNQLNVQLTDSNIIQDKFIDRFESRINYQVNQSSQSCDISLIDDLKMLDKFQELNSHNNSNNYITQSILNDNQSYHKQLHQQQNDNVSQIMSKKVAHAQNIRHRINSLYNQQPRFNQELQYQDSKISHIFKNTIAKDKQKLPKRMNTINIQNAYHQQKNETTNHIHEKSSNSMADIQQKPNVLRAQIQSKIKNYQQQKNIIYEFEKRNQINNLQESFIQNHSPNHFLQSNEPIASQAVSFILPLKEEDQFNNLQPRSKFISLNRETSQHKQSNSANKNIIFKQNNYQFKTKNSQRQFIFNGQSSKRKTQKSLSKQKYSMLNSINLRDQSLSKLRINNSKQKYQDSHVILNKNNTNQLIQCRKQQFAQFFKQKQSLNDNQNHSPQQFSKEINKIKNNLESIDRPKKETQNQNVLRQNHLQLEGQFNKSKVIKNYIQILSTVPKCRKCTTNYSALTLTNNYSVVFSCNQCDQKNKLDRSVSFFSSSDFESSQNGFFNLQKNSSQYNHPIIGVLFDLENKLENQQQMKTYNTLLKQINKQIQIIDEKRKKLSTLLNEIEQLKGKVQKNPKVIFEAKNELKKFLINNESEESKDLQNLLKISIPCFLPSQYLQELDLWCRINTKRFTDYPLIDSKLQVLCPLYMKKSMKTMSQFINPLFHNFQTTSVKISVSQGLKLPVKSLGKATFVIDGPYNISPFEQIDKLTLQFVNKRTFREIASVMQCLPQTVESIQLSYNHKLNSHISAQKYPILTKIVSLRSCKKLNAQILNCKDQDDLLSAFKVMTKKRQLKLQTTRSIYVRKPVITCTHQLKEMLKRLGKNICQIDLKLSVYFNQSQIYKELIITERNKLINFRLRSTVNQSESPLKVEKTQQKILRIDKISRDQTQNLNKKQKNKNLAKKCFFNKINKKLTAFVILKQSFLEKETLQFCKNQSSQINHQFELQKTYKANHLFRLQVLKMLI